MTILTILRTITAITTHNIIITLTAGHIYVYTKRGTAISETECINKNSDMNDTIVSVISPEILTSDLLNESWG